MKPTISWRDRHGLCILKHETTRRQTQFSFCPGRCRAEVQRAESSQERVALNVQEISSGLPLLSMTRKSLFADEDLDVGLYARRQGGG
jgi:hypothetical protein